MAFIAQLVIAVIFFVLGELLRPKPDFEDAEAVPFEEARIPQVNPERKQTVAWGSTDNTSPHVMDVLEYNAVPIKKKIKTSIFSSEKVVIGHRYFFGIQLGLNYGPDNVLKNIYYDDVPLWSGTSDGTAATGGYVIDIDDPEFLGGRENGGGISGRFRFFAGNPTQSVPAYVTAFQNPAPAYRWTSYILMENVEVGETPNIDALSFTLQRFPDPLGLGAGVNQIGSEINGLSIVAECFGDDDWGFNRGAEVNVANMTTAATTIDTESNGISLKWTNNNTIDRIIEQVNKQYKGMLRFNPKSGLWEYKLLRNDYVFANLPILNEDNMKSFSDFGRANWSETVNQVEVTYSQRGSPEKPPPAVQQDQSNYKRQGRHKVLRLDFPGVYDKAVANQIAARELRINGFPLAKVQIIADRTIWDFLPGDPFRFQADTPLGIVDLVMRVGSIGFGDLDQTEINLGAVEDVFRLGTATFTSPPASLFTSVNPAPVAVSLRDVWDQNYYWAQRDARRTGLTLDKPIAVAAQPQGNGLEYALSTRQGTDAYVRETAVAWTPTGTLQSAVEENSGDGVEITTLIIENAVNAGVLTNRSTPADDDILVNGENLMMVVSSRVNPFTAATYEPELMAFDSVSVSGTTVTLTGVHRALADTLSAAFAAGDRVWFLTGSEIDGPGTSDNEYGNAASVDIGFITIATTGEASQVVTSETFRNRVNRPYDPRNFRIEGTRYPAGTYPLNQAFTLEWYPNDRTYVDGGGAVSELVWQDTTGAGSPTTIETGFEYVLEIYNDITDTLLRRVRPSGSLNTPAGDDTLTTAVSFEYTLAKQQADGGAFSRYRAELWVEESVTGAAALRSLLTVYRTWQVVIPVNLDRRGPIYNGGASLHLVAWPLTQDANYDEQVDSTGTSSDIGTADYIGKGPGPDPLVLAPYVPGRNAAGADWIANLQMPRNTKLDLPQSGNGWVQFWFRVAPDGQTNKRIIVSNGDDASNVDQLNAWRLLIDSTGHLEFQIYTNDKPIGTTLSSAVTFDDGKWHHFAVMVANPTTSEITAYFVDGAMCHQNPDTTHPTTTANTMAIGGYDAAETASFGWAQAQVAQIAGSNVYVESNSGSKTNVPFGTKKDIMGHLIDGATRTPYTAFSKAMLSEAWGRVFHFRGNQKNIHDWAELRNNTDQNFGASQAAEFDGDNEPCFYIQGSSTDVVNAANYGPIADGSPSYMYDFDGSSSSLGIICQAGLWHAPTYMGADPKEISLYYLININSLATYDQILYSQIAERFKTFESFSSALWDIFVDASGRICIHTATTSNGYRTRRVAAGDAMSTGEWYHVHITNEETNGFRVYLNGIEATVDHSAELVQTGDTIAVDDFINKRFTGHQNHFYVTVGHRQNTRSPWGTLDRGASQRFDTQIAEFGFARGVWAQGDIVNQVALAKMPFSTMKDILLDYSPENVFQIEDNTAADLRGNIITPTPTGTFTTDGHVPLAQDDTSIPQRFEGSQRLDYTSDHFLSSKGTGAFDNFTIAVVAQSFITSGATIFSNGDAALAEHNLRIGLGATWSLSSTGQTSIIGPAYTAGDMNAVVATHEDDAGTDRWNWYQDGSKAVAEATTARAYTGAAIDRCRIGDRVTTGQNWNGAIHYIAAYPYTMNPHIARRIGYKFRGFNGALLEIAKYIDDNNSAARPGFLYPLEDRNISSFTGENWVINSATIQNVTVEGSVTAIPAQVTMGMKRAQQLTSGNYLTAPLPTMPNGQFTMGAWMRVDSGTTAVIRMCDSADNDEHLELAIVSGAARFRYNNNSTQESMSGGTITAGEWAFIVITADTAGNDLTLYVNGVSVATRNGTLAIGTLLASCNTLRINQDAAGVSTYNASYQLAFGLGNTLLTAELVRELYYNAMPHSWQACAYEQTPVAQWLLDEPSSWVTQVYRDRFNDDYNAVPSSTGVTQGALGILPNRLGNCVDLDGANGGIDTNWLGYQTGAGARAFECWLEPGYVGTVVSMGANTDANAVVISVDGSGDLSIHIRGAGNERIWTTALDTGTVAHHLAVQLPAAGDSLHDFEVWIDGVSETTIGTAGTDTVLATTATLDFFIGEDITDIAKADGTGKIYGVTVYNAEVFDTRRAELHFLAGTLKASGIS